MSDSEITRQIRELRDRVSQLWKMEASGLVVARYTTNAGQSIANITTTIIDFEDLVYDTHSAVTTGAAWHFHAPVGGYYHVDVSIMFTNSTPSWIDGEEGVLYLYKEGAIHSILDRKDNYPSGGLFMQLSGSDVVYLAITETLDIRVYQGTGGSLDLYNNGSYNYVSICKV